MLPFVHSSVIYNSEDLETAQVPIVDEWTEKRWYIYTMEYYSAVKTKKILPFETAWMDLEKIMRSEISQSEKDKYHMITHTCNPMNKLS